MNRLGVSLVTLGDPARMTGGYLYHRKVADRAGANGAELHFVSLPDLPGPIPALAAGRVLRHAMRRGDVIALDSIAVPFLAGSLRLVRQEPLVAVVHQRPGGVEGSRLRRRFQAVADLRVYRRTRHLLVASQALADDLVGEGLDPEQITVLPPGRDLPEPPPGPPPDLRMGRRMSVLTVANWLPGKGLMDLLEAVSRLPPDAVTLHLVGDDGVDRRHRRLIRSRLAGPDLEGRVIVHGVLEPPRLASLYGAADVFALTSWEEAYGTVYGEAMAYGLPVVGWARGNLPNLATHDVEGLVLPPRDIPALSDALVKLSRDEALRTRLGKAAATRASRRPSWDETAQRFFAVLRDVAD